MRLAVLSGKGGTGKTLISVNLAAAAPRASYIDCDVEEPNGRLFLRPEACSTTEVCTTLPSFDALRCTGCRACVDFCRFHALYFVREKPAVFPALCHACGGCALVCPSGAVLEKKRPVGRIEAGQAGSVRVITGILSPGEASAVPVIRAALAAGRAEAGLTVIDCPPGSGCSVMESVSAADCCLFVAEPTAFGLHNFKMVHRLASLLHKPGYVVINRQTLPYPPLEDYCRSAGIPILLRLPFSEELARLGAAGRLACAESASLLAQLRRLLTDLGEEVGV